MTWYVKRATAMVLTGRSVAIRGRGDPERGKARIRRWLHPQHQRTRIRGAPSRLRTIVRQGGTQRPPHLQIERGYSPLSEFGFGSSSHVFPRHAGRLARHDSAGSPFDFRGPRGLDFSGVFRFRVIQTCEEFGGHIGSFGDGQHQSFSKKFLRSRGHVAILDPAGQPNKRLHPTAAMIVCSRG